MLCPPNDTNGDGAGKCLAYSSLQADSKVKFAAWPIYELAATWHWLTFAQKNQSELSNIAGGV